MKQILRQPMKGCAMDDGPLGTHKPDWVMVFENDRQICFAGVTPLREVGL